MMYNDADSDLPPFNDQVDGDEIFLFSNTKTSSTGASFLNDDEDDHQLRHHGNVPSTSSHHLPVDVDELLLNTNLFEQQHCDNTEDPLFWNCKDISDDQLNEIWPQNQLNLNGNTNLNINGSNNSNHNNNNNNNSNNNDNGNSSNHHGNLNLNQTLSLGPTTSLTNCSNNGNTQHQQIQNGIIINHPQSHLISQVQQHTQHSIISMQQQQPQQQHPHQPNQGIATLISQPSQIDQLQQQQNHIQHQQHHQQTQQQPQHIQLRLQQNDQIAHIQTQALQNVLQSQQQQLLQQQAGFHQPQQIIQHVDNFQNKWITLVATNDQFQTFNSIPPQQQLNNQQQVTTFFDKSSHTIIQTDNGPIAAQIPVNGVITTTPQQIVVQAPSNQPRAHQQQLSTARPLEATHNRQAPQQLPTQRQPQQNQPQKQKQSKQSQKLLDKPKSGCSRVKSESTSVPNNSDTSKKEVAVKLNKCKEKPTCLNCPYCKRSFSKNFDLQQHMRCHTGEKPFQCIVCGRGFAQKSNVKKHMQAHKVWPEGPNNPSMPVGHSSSRSRNNSASSSIGLNRDDECMQENESVHIKNELNNGTALGPSNDRKNDGNDIFAENRYSCSYCQFNGKTYFELKSHLTIHKREKVFKCIVSSCGKTFSGSDLQGFLDHVTGHKDLIYHCHLCSGQFYSLDEFGEHQKHHSSVQVKKSGQHQNSSNTNQHQAQNLSKPTTASLRQQNQQVVPPTHLQPQQNQRQYNQQQSINLTSHQVSHQKAPKILNNVRLKSNQKYFRCSKCMNRYTTQTALDHHLSISTHNFPCTECNKVFMCERYLRRHLNTHTAVQHVCTFCDKQFKTAAYLKMHSVVHTGEKPFRCNQCEAAFNRRDKLSRHKLTHETVKKFKCPFRPNIGCTKEFNRPDKLKAHVLTHSGVRPHPCDSCSRTFSRLSRLREHKKLHHEGHDSGSIKDKSDDEALGPGEIDILKIEDIESDSDNKDCIQSNSNKTIINSMSTLTNIDIVNGDETETNADNSIIIKS